MNSRARYGLIAAVALVLFLRVPTPAASQEKTGPAASSDKPAVSGDKKDAKPTPRLVDGHPDFSGLWNYGAVVFTRTIKHDDHVEIEINGDRPPHPVTIAKRTSDGNQPPYKPELLAKVKQMDEQENKLDPIVHCKPAGFLRVGAPVEIVHIPGRVVLFYEQEDANFDRIIPTDGRPHDPDADPSYNGDSVGHWDGETLVVDTVNFNDDTWLGLDGWFHSTAMHVTERISRDGDVLHYQATVEDPKVFTKPWVMNARTGKPTTQEIIENAPCLDSEFDSQHLVNHDHL